VCSSDLCDHMGHMNVMWYAGKFDEATWAFFASLGLTAAALKDAGRGMAAVQQNTTYSREAMPGDTLEIYSRTVEIKAKTIRFVHEMIDVTSGKTTATCELVAVHMDIEARKGIGLPDSVRELAASMT